MNAAELLQSVPDPGNTKVSGLLIGCIIDTSIGELSFLASKQDTGFRFKVSLVFLIIIVAAFVLFIIGFQFDVIINSFLNSGDSKIY